MSTVNDTDLLLVERNGVQYQITYDQMSTLNDDDLLLVERGGVQYKVEAQHVSTGANGLIIPPVEVLTPVNGAGITEFDSFEPVSSAITAVGEAGTIAKNTDEILSVAVEAPIVSWNIADGSSPSFVNTDINFATELAAKGVTAITGINLYLDNVAGYPYTSNLSGFTLNNVDLVAAAQVSLISYNGTPYNNSYGWVSFFNGGGYNQCQGTTTYSCLFQPYPLGTVAKLKVLSVGGRVSLLDQDGVEHFIIGSSGKKVLSFPTNTNFSGLSVGDEVQTGVTITAIDASAPSSQEVDVYATMNPEDKSTAITLANGNLEVQNSNSTWHGVRSTIGVSSGKWYWEVYLETGSNCMVGISKQSAPLQANYFGAGAEGWAYNAGDGNKYNSNSNSAYGVTWAAGDIIGVAFDADNGTLKYYVNGSVQNSGTAAFTGLTTGPYFPTIANFASNASVNFGQNAWTHEPPSGYVGLSESVTTYTYPSVTVDGGTWDTSNQSEVWSDASRFVSSNGFNSSNPATNAFDGSSVTYAQATSSGGNITFTPSTPISYSSSIKILMPSAGAQAVINGGSAVNVGNTVETTIASGSGTLTTLVLTASNIPGVSYIKIDDKFLVDTVEDSQVWSSGTYTGTAANNNYGVTDLFANVGKEGDPFVANTMWGLYQATATFTLDNPIPLTSNSTLELITYQSSSSSGSITLTGSAGSLVPTLTVNGGNVFGKTTVSDPYASLGDSITAITIAASGADWTALEGIIVDGKKVIDAGVSALGDRKLASSISYEKSLTFTDDTQLANMVGPLEMTDANGDVVTPVSDTIANVSGNVLTLQGDTNLAYFQPGDEVQTGVQVVSVDAAAPSITVDGGSWYGADGTSNTYEISKSLRFNSADSSYMHWTPSTAGNQKTWTWSGWVKRVNFGEECVLFSGSASPGANYYLTFSGGTGTGTGPDGLSFFYGYGIHVGTAANTFRDPSAWNHVVLALDTTQSTPADRVKIYVNGTEVTYSHTNYPSQNADLGINSSYTMSMGAINSYAAWSLSDLYLADVHFIDGQAIAPTAFGEVDSNGVWQPKAASIPSPNNGTTWSSSSYNAVTGTTGSTDMTNAFDGDLSTFTSLGSGDGSTTATVVFTPPSSITVNTGVRVYIGVDRGQTISVNGNQTNASVSAGWNDVSFTGTLTSLSIGPTNVGSSNHIAAIEIDGVVLTDGATAYGTNGFNLDFSDSSSDAALGYDAVGSNNWTVNNLDAAGSGWNQSQTWSSGVYGTVDSSYPITNIFSSDITTVVSYAAVDHTATVTLPGGPITLDTASSLRVYAARYGSTSTFFVNGNDYTTQINNTPQWYTITGETQISSFGYGTYVGGLDYTGIYAVEVNGLVLVDAGIFDPQAVNIDSLKDSPTSIYATLNPLDENGSSSLSNGNLDMGNSQGGSAWGTVRATIGASSGKYFAEYTCTASSGGFRQTIGVVSMDVPNGSSPGSNVALNNLSDSAAYFNNGQKSLNGSTSNYGETWTVGDIIGIALDVDATTVTFYKNGVSQGVASSALASDAALTFGGGTISSNETGSWNFGQRDFVYPVSGFEALTSANLALTIKDSSKHFDVVKYEGNSSTNVISGLGFSPDLVWIKGLNGYSHCLFDTVRGAGKRLASDGNYAEDDYNLLNSFNSDGFTLGTTAGGGAYVQNTTGSDAVAWAWNAGETTETIAAGSLTSSVYDQSQTWSNSLTASAGLSGATQAFDADISNRALSSQGTNRTLTFAPSSGVSFSSKLEVYCSQGGAVSTPADTSNPTASWNGNVINPGSLGWVTVYNGSGTIDSSTPLVINTNNANQYATLHGVKLDGKILVDSGVSVPAVPSIASEVRANPAAGFSIINASVDASSVSPSLAHGLNKKPDMIIGKNRDSSIQWYVWHKDLDINYFLRLNATTGASSDARTWGEVDSNKFHLGAAGQTAAGMWIPSGTDDCIFYAFHSVEGYSAIGSFIGNGSSTQGPFIFTGFKVSFLLMKHTGGDDWYIFDNERSNTKPLFANGTYGEQPDDRQVEFLSNGFKIRYDRFFNASGAEMIYMAFAEKPLNTTPEVDTSGDTQVALDALVAAATEIVDTDGTTMYLNGATGPWRTGLSIEGSAINAAAPGPSEITFTSQNQGTPAFSGVDATLASRTWTLESGTTATGPWTLVDTYVDYGVLSTQTGATPWTENKPTLQPNTFYRIKVQYDSTNATSVESVYNTFKTGDA